MKYYHFNEDWTPPEIPPGISGGDMPEEKIVITPYHSQRASILFPIIMDKLELIWDKNCEDKIILAVCGGSGVGKSGIAAALAYYLQIEGIGSYVLSGDNYPLRIPRDNDLERFRIFREAGLRGMLEQKDYTLERFSLLQQWQNEGEDANPAYIQEYPWIASYQEKGRNALAAYLGSKEEQSFEELENILWNFKAGCKNILLRRLGRSDNALWYEPIDFARISVLIVEWTHGNSDNFEGVDIPILLNSTPQETMEYRRTRNRDGAVDSAFTTMVLEIEQKQIEAQAHKAKIIMSKRGEILTYEQYLEQMREGR